MHVHTSLSCAMAQGTKELQGSKSKICPPGGPTLQVLIAGAISAQLQNCGSDWDLPTLHPGHAVPASAAGQSWWMALVVLHSLEGILSHTEARGEANKLATCS